MWINLDENEYFRLASQLGPEPALAFVQQCIEHYRADKDDEKYINAVPISEGDLECDSDAVVSKGDDPGAYVMCWKWVDDEDAGIEKPEVEEL